MHHSPYFHHPFPHHHLCKPAHVMPASNPCRRSPMTHSPRQHRNPPTSPPPSFLPPTPNSFNTSYTTYHIPHRRISPSCLRPPTCLRPTPKHLYPSYHYNRVTNPLLQPLRPKRSPPPIQTDMYTPVHALNPHRCSSQQLLNNNCHLITPRHHHRTPYIDLPISRNKPLNLSNKFISALLHHPHSQPTEMCHLTECRHLFNITSYHYQSCNVM